MIKYKVELIDLNSHCFQVTLVIPQPLINQALFMPSWIPGSYVIRDFAKHLSKLTISQSGQDLDFKQIKCNQWVVLNSSSEPLSITYLIYAFDKSVRGAFLDLQRGFFNATSVCLCPLGFENKNIALEIVNPGLNWKVVTGLPCAPGTPKYAFGTYLAKNYDQLIDCPVSMGDLLIKSFKVQNILHDIAISGDQDGDYDRLAQDVQKICETQVSLFKCLPTEVSYYCFLLHVSHEGYGGIEHVNSSSLLINKFAIPQVAESRDFKVKSKSYIELLGLFSHEYFHLWMVKQIKPAVFLDYDLTQPNYTTQLWAFEGFTAYYDDLILVRAGLITQDQYFDILADNINKLYKTPGRKYQTLKSASFDAWIKFYKPDENSINSTVSYYLKGALLALCCDLLLRIGSSHDLHLDNMMVHLWQEYGQKGRGLEEGDLERLLEKYAPNTMPTLLSLGLDKTEELPLKDILTSFGLELEETASTENQPLDLAAKLSDYHTMLLCHEVYQGGMFQQLGIQPGDILVACENHRITYLNHQMLFRRHLNRKINIHVFREDKLIALTGMAPPNFVKTIKLKAVPGSENHINKWLLEN